MSSSSSMTVPGSVPRTRYFLLGLGAFLVVLATYFLVDVEDALFAFLHTDLLIALYLLMKHLLITGLLIAAAWWLMAAVQGRRTTLRDLGMVGRMHHLNQWWFLALAGGGIVCSIIGILLGEYGWSLLLSVFHISLTVSDWGLAAEGPLSLGESILALCVFSPVSEEIFFRGFLSPGLALKFAPVVAVLGSACILLLSTLIHLAF